MTAALPELHRAAGVGESDAAEADRITDLCDRVAFDFCVEGPASGRVAGIEYTVDGYGGITLDPWPLRPSSVGGIILGFRDEGYPDVLEPVVVPFDVRPSHM